MVGSRGSDRKVVNGHHPLVHWLYQELERVQASALNDLGPDGKPRNKTLLSKEKIFKQAGLYKNAPIHWRDGRMPSIANFDAICNLLGYRLTVVKIDDKDTPHA